MSLRVPMAWQEAVAIAQEVAREAAITGVPPGLDNCRLSASGAVEISGASRAPFVTDPAAGTLDALLNRDQAPPALLALLDRAEDLEAGGTTDLAGDLQFFARPDAPATIAALVARALAMESDAAQQAEFDRLRKDVSVPPPATPLRAPASRRSLGKWVPAAIALAMIVAAGVLAASAYRKSVPATPAESAAPPATAEKPSPSPVQQIAGRIDALVDKGLEMVGLRAAEASAPAAPAPPADPPARRAQASRRTVLEPTRSALLLALPPVFDPLITASDTDADAANSGEPLAPIATSEVEPPVLRWPQLPNAPGTVPVDPARSYLELQINEAGTVDKIRLHSPSNSFHDRMLVSAAKAWVFHPAQKDGHPVKYLMRVPIE